MQVNVAGLRRNIKNLAHNYSDAQIKVREATSNDAWGPSATLMAEVADLTYNVVAFSEIMQMIWKRLNDHGKNWRHVYKALILLEYLIKTGTEKVAQQCKENIFAIQTLKEFQYIEEGKDQGSHVREKAKQLVSLLKDDERLKNERTKALKAKERFAQHASGFGSDGSIDGPTHRDTPPWTASTEAEAQAAASAARPAAPDIEFVRPQTVGEEELQLQLAMAMSREEAEQEEQKRRSDDVRLQLALSQSEQDFKKQKPAQPKSHIMDLLDISMGATSISSPTSSDPWVLPSNQQPQHPMPSADPWSRNSSPPADPWQPVMPPKPISRNGENWPSRTQSPSVTSGSSTEGWLQNAGSPPTGIGSNGNIAPLVGIQADPWLGKTPAPIDLWLYNQPQPVPADPWHGPNNVSNPNQNIPTAPNVDPWAPALAARPSPIGALTSPSSDLDEFDIITNRSKSSLNTQSPINGTSNNNNLSLLDELDPLSTKNQKPPLKTPQAFLGENSSLVNLDNLIKPAVTNSNMNIMGQQIPYNPFSEAQQQQQLLLQQQQQPTPQRNMFQQTQPVPSMNQLKQTPFPLTLNQDPWTPSNAANQAAQNNNMPWMKPEAAASNPFLS